MAQTLYFYDLETSGVNARAQRVMQFAGIRTDLQLNPIGEPDNYLIKLHHDILPDPEAILITGITPQQTLQDGYLEPEFLREFFEHIAVPDTIFMGFNTVRFDDEFMRFMLYRNFYDAYEWEWSEGRSRWDLLDVVRMTRALRPEGINWPFAADGSSTNRLELLTSANKLSHDNAHDALSDVRATIEVARLLKGKQPKLFEYLLEMRTKSKVEEFVKNERVFVYTSGKYPGKFEKTTVVTGLAPHPKKAGVLVYDLRNDPDEFLSLSPEQLVERWQYTRDESAPRRLPVKTLQFNRCPAVAPLGVLDVASKERLQVDTEHIQANLKKLEAAKDEFVAHIYKAVEILDTKQQQVFFEKTIDVDERLYDGFVHNNDKTKMSIVRAAAPEELGESLIQFSDARLNALLLPYKARNYSKLLTDAERQSWSEHIEKKLQPNSVDGPLHKYFARLLELSTRTGINKEQKYLLEELTLYGQSLI